MLAHLTTTSGYRDFYTCNSTSLPVATNATVVLGPYNLQLRGDLIGGTSYGSSDGAVHRAMAVGGCLGYY